MLEFAVESSHENVQIGLECAQVVESLLVDAVDHARVEVARIDVLWSDGEDSVGNGNVDVCGLFGDAVDTKTHC